jgi:integrase
VNRFHAAYVLAVYLGLRRAEVLGLRWRDVDLDAGWLQVTQTLQRIEGQLRFLPPKTRHSRRTVPMPKRPSATVP